MTAAAAGGSSSAPFTVHPSAIVDLGAQIGAGSRVWHFVHVCGGARIGERCSLGQNVFVGNRVVIGNNVKIQNNVSVYDNVTLEDDVFCGPSTHLLPGTTPDRRPMGTRVPNLRTQSSLRATSVR